MPETIDAGIQFGRDLAATNKRIEYFKEKASFWREFAVWLKEEKEMNIDQLLEEFKKDYYE